MVMPRQIRYLAVAPSLLKGLFFLSGAKHKRVSSQPCKENRIIRQEFHGTCVAIPVNSMTGDPALFRMQIAT
jgi:hypothetical protein